MEIGITGQPPLPKLPKEKPSPLHHLLERLKRGPEDSALDHLRATLHCLEFLERYFAGFATGLLRKLDDSAELATLAQNAVEEKGLRRLLRFSFHRLEKHPENEAVRDLLACFFLHGKRSLPFSHARWLGLTGPVSDGEGLTLSHETLLENLAANGDSSAIRESRRQTMDVLQSWLEGALLFFETYIHFARIDAQGWQCTVRKGDLFVEIVPPIPARLIPLEAQAPTVAPETEDESSLLDRDIHAREVTSWDPPDEVPHSVPPMPVESSPKSPDTDQDSTVEGSLAPSEPVPDTEAANPQWSASELKSFENSLRQIYPQLDPERVPRDYFNTVNRFLSSVSSGYILVEGRQGTGKTTLANVIRDYLCDSSLDVTPLLFSVKNQFHPDTHTFLEQLNEQLRIRPGSGQRSFEALDPQVIKNLNLRTSAEARSQRFSSFLSELRLVNGTRVVLILDGLDEGLPSGGGDTDSLFSHLPAALPEGVYAVVTYHPDRCRPSDREILKGIHQGSSTEIVLSADGGSYRDLMERFLNRATDSPLSEGMQETLLHRSGGRLATAQHMLDGLSCQLFEGPDDLPPPDQTYERLFDRLYARVPDRYLDLFLLLATSDEPVSGEELSNLGISRTDVLELVHSLPSLFHCYQERNVGLNLAHRAIRLHLQRTFLTSYAQSCLRLAKRALHRISETEVTILPVREDLDRLGVSVRRLLRWAIDSTNVEFLAEASDHKLLGKLRRRIFSAMEERGLYHRKVLILDTFAKGLDRLVSHEGLEKFREELAWTLSSRALSYYHLGHFHRALLDIETAIAHFQHSVEQLGQENLRNGLAAAFNRRSEIYRGMGESEKALPDADRAVQNYERVVSSGRADLTSLLMLSLHNRAVVRRALGQLDAARSDVDISLSGYLRLVDRENRRDLRPQLAAVQQTRTLLAFAQGDTDLALSSAAAAIELYEILVHQENFEVLRNELAAAYNDRGAILFRAQILDEAERDYASAISIRTFLVAEGRIDVRPDLAKTYSNRGLCLIPLAAFEEAKESFDRAVEILDRLIEDERREDLYANRAFALNCRGSLGRQTNDIRVAREDFSAAAGDYRLAVVSQGDKHLEDLAHTLNSLAEVCLSTGDTVVARRSCERVLEIYEQRLPPDRRQPLARERAIAHHNLGETLRLEGDEAAAEKEFHNAIELLTFEVEQQGRPQLTGELATSLLRYAELEHQEPESRLKLLSRALAFFAGAEADDERFANLIDEALLLRASSYKKLKSFGSALDDVSLVVQRLEDSRWAEPTSGSGLVNALLERSGLFSQLGDSEAAHIDLDRADKVVEELDELTDAPEVKLLHCHILFERIRLLTTSADPNFELAVAHFCALDERLDEVPLDLLATKDLRNLKRRVIRTFKNLWLCALAPTRDGNYQAGVSFLTKFLDLAEDLRPNLSELLKGDPRTDSGINQIARLRTQRAWAMIRSGQLDEALVDFEITAQSLPPIDETTAPGTLEFIAEVESGRGAVLDSLERFDEALSAYTQALIAFDRRSESALSPRRAACLENRARLYQRQEKFREALRDIDPAIEIARSGYQKRELMQRWSFKASVQRQAGDQLASLSTLREALIFGLKDRNLEPHLELPLRLGIFRLTENPDERSEALKSSLALLKTTLRSRPQAWREEAVRLFQELPYPSDDDEGLELEKEIVATVEVLLNGSEPGYSSMTETLMRRASKLASADHHSRSFNKLSSALYCLATRFCLLEFQKYGERSLERLLRCYLLTGRSLVDADAPSQLESLGKGMEEISRLVYLDPPSGNLEVEINNLSRLWMSLPPSKVLMAGVSRATLQKLRRW